MQLNLLHTLLTCVVFWATILAYLKPINGMASCYIVDHFELKNLRLFMDQLSVVADFLTMILPSTFF